MKVFGQLERAQFENIVTASEPVAGVMGRAWLNSTTALLRYDDGSTLRTVVTLNNTQSLSNKTIVAPLITTSLQVSVSGSTDALWVTTGSNVGIGTSTPNLGSVGGRWLTVMGTAANAGGFIEFATPVATTQSGQDVGGINAFNGTVHAGEANVQKTSGGSSANYAWRFRTATNTLHLFEMFRIGGPGAVTSSYASIGGGGSYGLTGTVHIGFDVTGTANTADTTGETQSGATFCSRAIDLMAAYRSKIYTEAASYHTASLRHFYQDNALLGTGHIVDCEVVFYVSGKATGGTVTKFAGIADNLSFNAQDYVINFSSTNAALFSGVVSTGDGAVGACGWAFSGDLNCGAYRIGNDDWAFAVGGVRALQFQTTGISLTLDTYFSSGSDNDGTGSAGAINTAGGLGVSKKGFIGTTLTVGSHTTIKSASELRFNNSGNTFYVGFKAGSPAANKIWTLPDADGSANYFLQTNGSGVLSWAVPTADVVANGKIAMMFDYIVGSAGDVSAGYATHSTISGAITAASAGDSIFITDGTYTETITVSKKLFIVGKGHATILNGTVTFQTAADYSLMKCVKIANNITFDAGATGIFLVESWQANGKTVTDNGTDNSISIIRE